MALDLITGVPGAGKTLYAVAQVLRPLVGTTITKEDGTEVPRRIVVGGVRDLVIEHEPIDVPTFDPEKGTSEWDTFRREPGDEPLDVPHRADNWWLWCRPGDTILIDECQRLFRPMAAGRKIPQFIARLEVHRHYGVHLIIVTQHPQLVHVNVRNLVTRHRHLRRLFGRSGVLVHEWDHCTSPNNVKSATITPWRHDKSAFDLYKSAELHTKPGGKLPFALWILAGLVVVAPLVGWFAYHRMTASKQIAAPGHSSQAVTGAAAPGRIAPGATDDEAPPRRREYLGVSAQESERKIWGELLTARLVAPIQLAGCVVIDGDCSCWSNAPVRRVTTPGAICLAVVHGQVDPNPRRPLPERYEPRNGLAAADAASAPPLTVAEK